MYWAKVCLFLLSFWSAAETFLTDRGGAELGRWNACFWKGSESGEVEDPGWVGVLGSGSVSCVATQICVVRSVFVGAEEQARYLGSSMSLPSPSERRESLLSTALSMASLVVGLKELQFGQTVLRYRREGVSQEELLSGSRRQGMSRPYFFDWSSERSDLGDYMLRNSPDKGLKRFIPCLSEYSDWEYAPYGGQALMAKEQRMDPTVARRSGFTMSLEWRWLDKESAFRLSRRDPLLF
ncbi:hypothetical protein Bca4012_018811 [Brassica carinata]